ncbi:PREDICTED: MARD1 [Prunus dulcis]|uniref:PREDICTED: MARD1 n=1 Tax=Prunus dulcis TaxID=3755 RepID=A0A5E4EZ08_PRUDU|nr:FCS-Like Zinc finger 8 [Prunus dulcis]XP_034198838.1 FCS-Like Zinc finger 8 [Prunus dulcis]VVA20923.1 PREDICTED: MARD1 [Prunus dulcis]
MADNNSLPSPADKYTKPTSSFFTSPRLFTSFTSKGYSETDAVMSPTSILETKPFFGLRNPFWSESNTPRTPEPETKRPWDKLDPKGIGLAIVDALNDDGSNPKPSKPESRMVIFGSQLKIQIPHLQPSVLSPSDSPKSAADFSIRTKNSQLGSFSSVSSESPAKNSPFKSANSGLETMNSARVFTSCLSVSEMELSEDYTCVISHGPNPKTTHIFDNCIVESSEGVPEFSPGGKVNGSSYLSESFLSFCDNCKNHLGPGKDIFMYRGEKAFCSRECRYQEMLLEEEGVDKL